LVTDSLLFFLHKLSTGLEAFLEEPAFFCQIVLAGASGEKMSFSGGRERVGEFSLARERKRQLKVGDSQFRFETQRFGEFVGGFDKSILLRERFTQAVMGLPECGAKAQSRFELKDRFIEPVFAREKVGQIVARIRRTGI
jgi:hypothetical protein